LNKLALLVNVRLLQFFSGNSVMFWTEALPANLTDKKDLQVEFIIKMSLKPSNCMILCLALYLVIKQIWGEILMDCNPAMVRECYYRV